MLFKSIMHISFHTDHFDEMLDFYINKLGAQQKVVVRWKSCYEMTFVKKKI